MARETRHIVFFDLDDTIYDRTGLRLQILLPENGCIESSELSSEGIERGIEHVQRASALFEALGFPSFLHSPESECMIAALALLYGDPIWVSKAWGINRNRQRRLRESVEEAGHLATPAPGERWTGALLRELAFRQRLRSHPEYGDLKQVLEGIAADRFIQEAARQIRRSQNWRPYHEFQSSWGELMQEGAQCFIASEGYAGVQKAKLGNLGLGPLFADRLITTGQASTPEAARSLRDRVDCLLNEVAVYDTPTVTGKASERDLADRLPADLLLLYPFKWVLDTFSTKTSGFYALALHAAISCPDTPGLAVDSLNVVTRSQWTGIDLRFAMIGDAFDKDIVPVRQLLGSKGAWTGLLRIGRHAGDSPEITRAGSPSMAFDSWPELAALVSRGLPWESVTAPDEPPRLVDKGVIRADHLRGGLKCDTPIVRHLAEIILDQNASVPGLS